jgi:putative ABC transport system permease protein
MLTDIRHRLRSLFRARQVDAELDEEIRFHLDELTETYVRRGMPREDAIRRARMAFGGVDQVKEAHRDARGLALVDHLHRDVRHALRQIRRTPGFAAVAILCLGLGIGVNTTIFSMINAVFLRPLAVNDPARVVALTRGEQTAWAYPTFQDFRERSRTLDAVAMAFPMESDVEIEGESSFVAAEVISSSYGGAVGARLALGRWVADDSESAAVISHALWERRFHLSPSVLGQQIRSESQAYTIVGVTSPEFVGVFAPMRTDLWVPARTRPALFSEFQDRLRTWRGMMLFGRLRADVTAAQAAAELNAIDVQLPAVPGEQVSQRLPILAEPLRALPDPGMRRRIRLLTTLLSSVVALVLMIACVNVGSLLLVRGALRQRELTVRRALGATRFGLVRQLLTEGLVLAAAGGVCGCFFAVWANRILTASTPALLGAFAVQLEPAVDWRAVLFAAAISLAATIACALAPALHASRRTKWADLRAATGIGPARRRPFGLVAQVVMSFVLLFVAGSFLQSLIRTQTTDPGFAVDGRLFAHVFAPEPTLTREERRRIHARAMAALRALPGVVRVGAISTLPLMPAGSDCAARPDGRQISVTSSEVSAGYFDTMGIARLAGRDVAADLITDDGVVITRSLSGRLWPDGSALGSRVLIGCQAPFTTLVVGIVGDTAIRTLGESPQPHVYRQLGSRHSGMITLVVQAANDPADLVASVRQTLIGLAPAIRVYTTQPLSVHVEQRYAPFRWIVKLLLTFGTLALLLAAIGLYGVIACRVALRTQEIGVRMALGARRADVAREVLRYGVVIVLTGIAIGELCTAAVTRMIGASQEGFATAGVSTHAVVAGTWIVVALLACYLPAARAARVDPLVALRHD